MPRKSIRSTIPGKVRDATIDGAFIQISEYTRSTEQLGIQQLTALSFAPPELEPFQRRLIELEREYTTPLINRGRLIRRGVFGVTLYQQLSNHLAKEGFQKIHWRDIEGMLDTCERILRLRTQAGLEE